MSCLQYSLNRKLIFPSSHSLIRIPIPQSQWPLKTDDKESDSDSSLVGAHEFLTKEELRKISRANCKRATKNVDEGKSRNLGFLSITHSDKELNELKQSLSNNFICFLFQ